jgi:ribosomal protein S18 acetylase RimI-like enzyme
MRFSEGHGVYSEPSSSQAIGSLKIAGMAVGNDLFHSVLPHNPKTAAVCTRPRRLCRGLPAVQPSTCTQHLVNWIPDDLHTSHSCLKAARISQHAYSHILPSHPLPNIPSLRLISGKMSTLQVLPLPASKMEDFITLYWTAFEPPELDMLMPQIYPNGLTPQLMQHFKARLVRETDGDPSSTCFYLANPENPDAMLSVSRWSHSTAPPTTPAGIQESIEKAQKCRNSDPIDGMNLPLAKAMLDSGMRIEYETMGTRPYLSLRILATHPDHQRKGAGSALLKHGLEKADALGLPVIVYASVTGRPLYEKHGFQFVRELPLDAREYGARSSGRHSVMVRPARSLNVSDRTAEPIAAETTAVDEKL